MQFQRNALFFLRVTADLFIVLLCFWASYSLQEGWLKEYLSLNEFYLLISLMLLWLFTAKNVGIYDEFRSRNFGFEIIAVIKAVLVQALGSIIFVFFIKEIDVSRAFVPYYAFSLIALLTVQKYLFRRMLEVMRKKGKNLRNILIVGAGDVGRYFSETIINNVHFGYRLVGFLDDEKKKGLNGKYLGKISDLDAILSTQLIENVIIALPNYATERIEDVMRMCGKHTTRVKIIPDYFKLVSSKYTASMFGPFPVITVREDSVNEFHWRFAKRAFDIVFSLITFLTLFWWLWPLIGLFIKLSSKGPVFFKQERWGRDNRRFLAFKFRSMVTSSSDIDTSGKYNQATKDDPRITKIGKILRKTNLDELPQFWNVLKGEMSIVGPRPHPTPLNLESMDGVKFYLIRHLVKPGITGWAQCNGFRGETSEPEMMQKRVNHDIWYIENWNFWLDIQIIVLTVWRMLKGDPNAY